MALLENKGYSGRVYCIDGAPSVMHSLTENALGTRPEEVEINALLNILAVYNIPLAELRNLTVSIH